MQSDAATKPNGNGNLTVPRWFIICAVGVFTVVTFIGSTFVVPWAKQLSKSVEEIRVRLAAGDVELRTVRARLDRLERDVDRLDQRQHIPHTP